MEEEDAEGNKTWFTHDGLGRVVKKEVDLGGTDKIETWFTFDDNDRQVTLKDDTYLGHNHVRHTYWYIEAVPELLALATERMITRGRPVTP